MEVASESIEEAQVSPSPPDATHLAREANRLEAAMWATRQAEAVSGAGLGSSEEQGRGLQRMWGGGQGEAEGLLDPERAAREKRKVAVFLRILAGEPGVHFGTW